MLSNIITNLICSTTIIPENKALKATFELGLEDGEVGVRYVELLICYSNQTHSVYYREHAYVSYKDNSFPNFGYTGL